MSGPSGHKETQSQGVYYWKTTIIAAEYDMPRGPVELNKVRLVAYTVLLRLLELYAPA